MRLNNNNHVLLGIQIEACLENFGVVFFFFFPEVQ